MKNNVTAKIIFSLFLLASCSKESPELIPCMCDGSESTLGLFDCMCEPMKKKPVRRISYLQDSNATKYQTLIIDDEQRDAYLALHKSRNFYAPIKLEYVDFRIKKNRNYTDYDRKLGNYRFRIFGCRRETKNAFLNEGRTMQKDMHFFDVFYETMNDYYPVVVDKSNMYYLDSDRLPNPEYIVTAEITDYFMNICDEFDWNNVKQKKLRSGSSEITVTWRVMNLLRDEVYCKGTTTGYGQISEGEPNGETLLVERAFEDALTKLPEVQCFNSAISQRIRPEDIKAQLAYLQKIENSASSFASQYGNELKGISLMQECASGLTSQAQQIQIAAQPVTAQTVEAVELVPVAQIEAGQVVENGGTLTTQTSVSLTPDCSSVELVPVAQVGTGQVVESGGVSGDDCTVIKTVDNNVKISDDYWIDVPLNTDDKTTVDNRNRIESSFAGTTNKFCIANQPPYQTLNAQNLYKVRASIVAVENALGQKGAGLIISDNLVLTSADLMVKNDNNFNLTTINGKEMKASAFRVNPNKNIAVLLLQEPTKYTPLPLSLELPEVNKDILLTLGMLDLETEGEGYIDNEGKVTGYRWSEEKGAEIEVDTFVQTVTLGGALIDMHGNIVGLSHVSKKLDTSPDLFIPIETALQSVGLEICGRKAGSNKPKAVKAYQTPLADAIDNSKDKTPIPLEGLQRK